MRLTNDSYEISSLGRGWSERYCREGSGWVKESARGRRFRATAEQVLNHLVPAPAAVKPPLTLKTEYGP